jgi:hypothetical protein
MQLRPAKSRVTSERVGLRRIDWRFLLPNPFGPFQHLVLLGGSAGTVDRIQEVGLAQRVSCKIPTQRCADALIILADAAVDPAAAVSCLCPEGLLYWEINRRDPSMMAQTPETISRTLHALDFHSVRLYAARPNFETCQFYFPLETSASMKWFINALYVAQTPMQRAIEQGMRIFTNVHSSLFSQVLPYLAVVATFAPAAQKPPTYLYSEILPEPLQRTALSPFMFTDAGNRLVMLPFREDGTGPEVVVKIPKLTAFNIKNQNEQKSLNAIRGQLSPTMQRTVPEPLGLFDYGDIVVGMESYLPGQSLLRSSGRWGTSIGHKIEDLNLAAQWLTQFHIETENARHPWGENQIAEWVEAPIANYQEKFGLNGAEENLFRLMREQSDRLRHRPFPSVWQHRDFNVWNIFRTKDTIQVIDWEGGRLGPPLSDLIHFVTHWNEVVRKLESHEARLRGFRQLFATPADSDRIQSAIHRATREYMEQLHLDQGFFPLLLVYTWLELATRRFDQQSAHGEVESDPRLGNRQVDYLNVLARNADLLFAEEEWINNH